MARLGDWEYPEINLSASIDVARKITREFSGEVSRTGLARSLGMSERGGAFASRLAAIRLWGIATGRSRIRLTRDGLRAARPHSPSEAQLAMRDLAQSVPLFVELGKRLPQSSPGPEHLAVFVEEITGADQTAVGQSVTTIDRVFREVRQYLDDSGEPYGSSGDQDRRESHDSPESELQTDRGGVSSSTSWSERQVDTGGRLELSIPGASLSLPESLENLDLALTVLMARRRILAANDGSTGQKPAIGFRTNRELVARTPWSLRGCLKSPFETLSKGEGSGDRALLSGGRRFFDFAQNDIFTPCSGGLFWTPSTGTL